MGIWLLLRRSGGGGEGLKYAPYFTSGFFWAVMAGGTGAFLLGLWDDVRTLRPVAKLVVQVILALLPPLAGVRLVAVGLPGIGPWELPTFLGGAAAFAWVLFWINAYNFMDGINGIAGRFAEILAVALMILTLGRARAEAFLFAFLAGACYGFLAWNLPVARTFLGDCGSQFLGYLFAVWTLHVAGLFKSLPVAFPAVIVLTLPFFWDVVYTLVRRLIRGENLLKAHRSHLYQRLTATGLSHRDTLMVCEKTFLSCAVAAVVLIAFGLPRFVWIQWAALVFSIGTLVAYTRNVRRRERAGEGGETPPSPSAAPDDVPSK